MSPTTPIYLLFIAVSAMVYYFVPPKMQNIVLLVSSVVFYMWATPTYVFFISSTVIVCFASGIMIEKSDDARKKVLQIGTVIIVVGVLFFFKYFGFVTQVVVEIAAAFGGLVPLTVVKFAAPLGISFYTFQVIGYVIDVRHGRVEAEKDFINFALFVFFFPAIVSGPIGRANELLPQYKKARPFDYSAVVFGMQRFLIGAFRKVVLADGIGIIVDSVIGNPSSYGSLTVFAAVILYNVKIYCDFAGYSDMAVGVAQIFGIKVRENFFVPFFAVDLADYWKRWHISLTSWLRDYIYIPLGGNRKGFRRKLINIILVFVISGIWHGAAFGYIIWGLLHGVLRVLEEVNKHRNINKDNDVASFVWLRRAMVFFVSAFAFMFFTLNAEEIVMALLHTCSVRAAVAEILQLSFNGIASSGIYVLLYYGILAVGFLLMFAGDYSINNTGNMNPLSLLNRRSRWALYWFMGLSICWFYMIAATGAAGTASFIYAGF